MSFYLSHNYSNSIHVCLTDHEHFSFRFCVVQKGVSILQPSLHTHRYCCSLNLLRYSLPREHLILRRSLTGSHTFRWANDSHSCLNTTSVKISNSFYAYIFVLLEELKKITYRNLLTWLTWYKIVLACTCTWFSSTLLTPIWKETARISFYPSSLALSFVRSCLYFGSLSFTRWFMRHKA